MSKETEILYADVETQEGLFTKTLGSFSVVESMVIDSFTWKDNSYEIVNKHEYVGENKYLFACRKKGK